jgi:cell fate regulator YaaT (PSP1 superfamily)
MKTNHQYYLLRVGSFGQIGRFVAEGLELERGRGVVCRTDRGLELGEVLAAERNSDKPLPADGFIVRATTEQDELWLIRINRTREAAYQACVEQLATSFPDLKLAEVECLFDGKSLYFYFLGEAPPRVEALTEELARTYDATARLRRFTDAVERGCGPGCGTGAAKGCSSDCSACGVAGECVAKSSL